LVNARACDEIIVEIAMIRRKRAVGASGRRQAGEFEFPANREKNREFFDFRPFFRAIA
jgi:hypothetical protein